MRVSVIVPDCTVVVDGTALVVVMPPSSGLRAIQWDSDSGHGTVETTDGQGRVITDAEIPAPYIAAWRIARRAQMEKAATAAKDAKEAAAREAAAAKAGEARHRATERRIAENMEQIAREVAAAEAQAAAHAAEVDKQRCDEEERARKEMAAAESRGRKELAAMAKREKAAQKEAEKRRPYEDAAATLASTDYKIIREMERLLGEQGRLPDDLVAQRADARKQAKAAKKKLGIA